MAKKIHLTRKLWDEYVHQIRSKNCQKLNENKRRAKREALIVEHMPAVRGIACSVRHLFSPNIPFEDLVSCGYLGLTEAAGRYDPGRGAFAPYAYQRIRGAIIDAHKRKAYKEELHDSLDALQTHSHETQPARHDDNSKQYLTVDKQPLPEELAIQHERRNLAEAAIVLLPPDERAVMADALDGVPLAQVALARGRSVSWVRVRLANGKRKVAAVLQQKLAA